MWSLILNTEHTGVRLHQWTLRTFDFFTEYVPKLSFSVELNELKRLFVAVTDARPFNTFKTRCTLFSSARVNRNSSFQIDLWFLHYLTRLSARWILHDDKTLTRKLFSLQGRHQVNMHLPPPCSRQQPSMLWLSFTCSIKPLSNRNEICSLPNSLLLFCRPSFACSQRI